MLSVDHWKSFIGGGAFKPGASLGKAPLPPGVSPLELTAHEILVCEKEGYSLKDPDADTVEKQNEHVRVLKQLVADHDASTAQFGEVLISTKLFCVEIKTLSD
eukprot:tig00021680_g23030.t1